MPLYDYFSAERRTRLGAWVALGSTRHFARLIERYAPEAHDVVEIGPGAGWLARQLMARGCNYTCYEPNVAMADVLRANGATVRGRAAPPLEEADGSFDLFIASHVLEHMSSAREAFSMVTEATRVLRPRGVAAVVSPDFVRWGRDFYDCDYTHAYPVTATRLRQLMSDAGLRIECVLLRYGNMGRLAGAVVDCAVRTVAGLARTCAPTCPLLLKAGLTFHANVIAVGRKQ